MHKLRICIDTSVIGGCFDEEFADWSNKLFEEFINGEKIVVISEVIFKELIKAPKNVAEKLSKIPVVNIEIVEINKEIEDLADSYIKAKIITPKFYEDALHIACATYYKVNLLVSLNIKHIVNYNRIIKYNSVNLMNGFGSLEIRNPKEVVYNEEEF